eukprot:304301-Amphidinium_carterae.1
MAIAKAVLRIKRGKAFYQHGWIAESARALLSHTALWQRMEIWLLHIAAQEMCPDVRRVHGHFHVPICVC